MKADSRRLLIHTTVDTPRHTHTARRGRCREWTRRWLRRNKRLVASIHFCFVSLAPAKFQTDRTGLDGWTLTDRQFKTTHDVCRHRCCHHEYVVVDDAEEENGEAAIEREDPNRRNGDRSTNSNRSSRASLVLSQSGTLDKEVT